MSWSFLGLDVHLADCLEYPFVRKVQLEPLNDGRLVRMHNPIYSVESPVHGPRMEVLGHREWFKRLEATFNADWTVSEVLSANPALKLTLLSFFESLLSKEGLTGIFNISCSIALSTTMRSLKPVNLDCLEAWVSGWIHGTEI
jgi:hypothetical protein